MPLLDALAASPAELEARVRLHMLPSVRAAQFFRLLDTFGSASAALSAPASAWAALRLNPAAANARRTPEVRDAALATMRWLERPGCHLSMWDQAAYPALLKEIPDPPPLLFIEGQPAALSLPQVAIVGSRHASAPALDHAAHCARQLAEAGLAITSGLALGIDGAAHRGALAVAGATLAVLGAGLENIYPHRHRVLARDIAQSNGALVSEYPLHTPPHPGQFPQRNRIISGMALGVLVVEAKLASGSLITARLAAEQGREVYAMPGPVHHGGAKGCHQLIRDGAQLVEGPEHILESLNCWSGLRPAARPHDEPPLLRELGAAPRSAEALASALQQPLPAVLAALTELELAGRVVSEAGRWFARPMPDTLRPR